MKTIFSKVILMALFSLWINLLIANPVVLISGTIPFVEPGCEYEFNAQIQDIPSTWTDIEYEWQATNIGSNGLKSYVAGYTAQGLPNRVTTSSSSPVIAKTTQFWVVWDGSVNPAQGVVKLRIKYKISTSTAAQFSQEYLTQFMTIKGIPSVVNLTGPVTIQKCCPSSVTYTVNNFGYANSFDNWTYPAGWQIVSQSNNSITFTPDQSTGGVVSCRVRYMGMCTTLVKNISIPVSRFDATLSLVETEFPLLRICPNSSYTYKVNPICGATSYSWQFPAGWTITAGGTTNTVTVNTNSVPQSGNIVAAANFNGCISASLSRFVSPLTGIPPVAQFDFLRRNSRCGHFYVCKSGGQIYNLVPIQAQSFTYSVTAPWFLTNPSGQQVSTLTLSFDQPPPMISLAANALPGMGTYTISANNCFGSSINVSTIFFPESECYCTGELINPFQDGVENPCIGTPNCGNPDEPTPFRVASTNSEGTDETISETFIYPNPTNGAVFIDSRIIDPTAVLNIQLMLADGRIAAQVFTTGEQASTQLSNSLAQLPAGIYLIRLSSEGVNYQQRIVKSE